MTKKTGYDYKNNILSTKTIKRKCMIYYTDGLTSPLGSSNLA